MLERDNRGSKKSARPSRSLASLCGLSSGNGIEDGRWYSAINFAVSGGNSVAGPIAPARSLRPAVRRTAAVMASVQTAAATKERDCMDRYPLSGGFQLDRRISHLVEKEDFAGRALWQRDHDRGALARLTRDGDG